MRGTHFEPRFVEAFREPPAPALPNAETRLVPNGNGPKPPLWPPKSACALPGRQVEARFCKPVPVRVANLTYKAEGAHAEFSRENLGQVGVGGDSNPDPIFRTHSEQSTR